MLNRSIASNCAGNYEICVLRILFRHGTMLHSLSIGLFDIPEQLARIDRGGVQIKWLIYNQEFEIFKEIPNI